VRSSVNLYLPLFVLPVVALIQTTILPRLQLVGLRPDLVLLTVISWSLFRGAREGMYWGFIGGGLIGLLSAAPLGIHAFAMTFSGLVSGVGEQNMFRHNLLLSLGITMIATTLYYITSMLMLQLVGWNVAWLPTLTRVVVPLTLLNTLLVPLAYRIIHPLQRLTGPPELSW